MTENEIKEGSEKIETLKEQVELLEEKQKVLEYKKILEVNSGYNIEIQEFIDDVINKYRDKVEVINYYFENPNNRDIPRTQYNLLCTIDSMLNQYAIAKFGEEFFGKKN